MLLLQFERRTNLSRFEGSNSISSAEYFGESSQSRQSSASTYSGPDLYEIKEGVRAGVTKVAGKLSTFANGVMTSLQVSELVTAIVVNCKQIMVTGVC